jgi:predicted restriction endonuclease
MTQVTTRVGQGFFRRAVLSAYDYRCCITGLSAPKLLLASHIVPWSVDASNRLNPKNGLCLSALHDKAFDAGIITIGEDMTVSVSRRLAVDGDLFFESAISAYHGKSLALPEKFRPDPAFLMYHRQHVFQG